MQKRKIDELISHFNRKVADMDIDRKYKMELLGMITAIGIACEKELSIEPERKTGKWEQDPLAKALDVYICSECKQPLQCRGEYGSLAKVNFCPTCGARMEV